jgi:hypothetical protein
MEVATRLALYLGCLIVALVAGWALGEAAVLLNPDMAVPGTAPFHGHAAGTPAYTSLAVHEEIS